MVIHEGVTAALLSEKHRTTPVVASVVIAIALAGIPRSISPHVFVPFVEIRAKKSGNSGQTG